MAGGFQPMPIQQKLNPGYIFFLDDDDQFLQDDAIEEIINSMQPGKLAIWRVQFPDRVIPSGSFGLTPTLYDVTGIGLCYHTSQIKRSDWTPWKCADYRTAKGWSDNEIIWVDRVLTGLQSNPGGGFRVDTRPKHLHAMNTIKSTNKSGKVKVQFLRSKDGYQSGAVAELPWIVAANYIHRGIVKELEPETTAEVTEPEKEHAKVLISNEGGVMGLQKEEKAGYQTKQEKRAPRKTKKNETEG
jgi:hypothetical protein